MPVSDMSLSTCKDPRGKNDCFAILTVGKKQFAVQKCKCLSDTSKVPCPFYKSQEQYDKEIIGKDAFQ